MQIPTFRDVIAAQNTIRPYLARTPLHSYPAINDLIGAEVFIKHENYQPVGAVCYLGEDVDNYKNGKVVDHTGSWLTGEHNARPGILIPAHPKVGDKFHSENVPGIAVEADEVVSIDETVKTPAGTYKHCVKIKEMVEGEKPEYKYYAQ